MTYSSLTDDGHYRQAQEHEEAKLAQILNVLDRVRSHTHTTEDIDFLEHELTPYSTHKGT